jgi:hypothetical protein
MHDFSWAWWYTPLIPALGRQRQVVSEFKASLVYKVSSRTARAIQRNPISKNQKKKKKKKKETNKPQTIYSMWTAPSVAVFCDIHMVNADISLCETGSGQDACDVPHF